MKLTELERAAISVELVKYANSVLDGHSDTSPTIDRIERILTPAPARSAEEILKSVVGALNLPDGNKTFTLDEVIVFANYYASQFRREVSDDEIEAEADKYGFRVPYDGSNNFYDKTAIKAFIDGAKWMREKMTGK